MYKYEIQQHNKTAQILIWDITTLKVKQHFKRTRRLHLQDKKISQTRNWSEAGGKTGASSFYATRLGADALMYWSCYFVPCWVMDMSFR
jgi:hypothetical protein